MRRFRVRLTIRRGTEATGVVEWCHARDGAAARALVVRNTLASERIRRGPDAPAPVIVVEDAIEA